MLFKVVLSDVIGISILDTVVDSILSDTANTIYLSEIADYPERIKSLKLAIADTLSTIFTDAVWDVDNVTMNSIANYMTLNIPEEDWGAVFNVESNYYPGVSSPLSSPWWNDLMDWAERSLMMYRVNRPGDDFIYCDFLGRLGEYSYIVAYSNDPYEIAEYYHGTL